MKGIWGLSLNFIASMLYVICDILCIGVVMQLARHASQAGCISTSLQAPSLPVIAVLSVELLDSLVEGRVYHLLADVFDSVSYKKVHN
jgi:hypothetical protein